MHINGRTLLAALFGTGVVSGAVGLYSWWIEPAWIDVKKVQLKLPRLEQVFRGYRLMQLSDLHCDDIWMTAERLQRIVRLANRQEPDVIVITGDLVTRPLESAPHILAALKGLRARDGVFAVLGNHDHWSGVKWIRSLVQASGVRELNDTSHTIERADGAMLHLVGLDDLWPVPGAAVSLPTLQKRVQSLADQLPTSGAAILLVHEPDIADIADSIGRFDLQLSGHSHGGQVRLPWYGVLRTPRLGSRYPDGLYRTGNLWHYTNRGLGMVHPQVRFNCRPEITVFELQ